MKRDCIYFEMIGDAGGMKQYNQSFVLALSKCYDQVHAVVPTNETFPNNAYVKRIYDLKKSKWKIIKFYMFITALIYVLKKALRTKDIDIFIHIFHQNMLTLVKIIILGIFSRNLFIVYHDISDLHVQKRNYKNIIFTLLVNKACAHLAQKVFTHSYHMEGEYLPHTSVNLKRLPHVDYGSHIHKSSKCQMILYYGNFSKHDNFISVYKQLKEFSKQRHDYVVKIAGQLSDSQLKAIQMDPHGALRENFFVMNGFITDEDLCVMLNEAQFVVLPYKRVFSSGVLLRALSHNCIPVCQENPEFSYIPCLKNFLFDGVSELVKKLNIMCNAILEKKIVDTDLLEEFLQQNSIQSLTLELRNETET